MKARFQSGRKAEKTHPRHVTLLLIAGAAGVLLFLVGGMWLWPRPRAAAHSESAVEASKPHVLRELLAMSPDQIQQFDVALVNLLCAEGLPGAEDLEPSQCLSVLDQWVARVKAETARHLYRFRANSAEYDHSEGYFRMLMMAVVMCEDFGVRYNPERITIPSVTEPNDSFFADSRDLFLHGLVSNRRLGTCSSMPVLYLAIGRRVGYPLKLVTTKAHLFLRWEDSHERFDLEATGKGMNRYDDAHFKQWPFPVTEEECHNEGYLKSLTPAEELAVFLSLRGNCLKEVGRFDEAGACYVAAARFAPGWNAYHALLASVQSGAGGGNGMPVVSLPAVQVGMLPPPAGAAPAAPLPDPNPLQRIR